MKVVYLFCLLVVVINAQGDPARFLNFFLNNVFPSGLPLSYFVPTDYFKNVPANDRENWYTEPINVPACNNKTVAAPALNAYSFQSEQYLSTAGLNIYDGAVWSIATALLGHTDKVKSYQSNVLLAHQTLQLGNIKADAPCKGIMANGECGDPGENGACGLCYGLNKASLPTANAYFFRMISDIWSFDGTSDARCPELGHTWTWNDWRPVTGENAWANLVGPLQVAYIAANGNVDAISDDSVEIKLAVSLIPAIQAMILPNGAVLYSPFNTWDFRDKNVGATVSIENNSSLLSGLRALLYILTKKTNSSHKDLIPVLQDLTSRIQKFLLSAYDPSGNFFRQGGRWNTNNGTFTWGSGVPMFSVDCQTWLMAVLGAPLIDSTHGMGTAAKVWETTKKLGGYLYNPVNGRVQGVGFAQSPDGDILSGEWSFGALNMLNIFSKQYTNQTLIDTFKRDITDIRGSIENRLTNDMAFPNGAQATAVLYSNKRYYIPFGWYANPIPSTASTGWAVFADKNYYNPFVLGGGISY